MGCQSADSDRATIPSMCILGLLLILHRESTEKQNNVHQEQKIPNHLLLGCYHQNLLNEPTVVESILAIFNSCLCTWDSFFELPAAALPASPFALLGEPIEEPGLRK